jgi:hypothetical protein
MIKTEEIINESVLKPSLMKKVIYLVIALLATSCLKPGENSYYIMTTGRVEIIQSEIPDTGIINQFAELKARAEESNGCWSNLNFVLTKKSDFEYTLEAFGVFESYGICEDIKVYGDTTIPFKPTKEGLYKFQITKSETVTVVDSMVVAPED